MLSPFRKQFGIVESVPPVVVFVLEEELNSKKTQRCMKMSCQYGTVGGWPHIQGAKNSGLEKTGIHHACSLDACLDPRPIDALADPVPVSLER